MSENLLLVIEIRRDGLYAINTQKGYTVVAIMPFYTSEIPGAVHLPRIEELDNIISEINETEDLYEGRLPVDKGDYLSIFIRGYSFAKMQQKEEYRSIYPSHFKCTSSSIALDRKPLVLDGEYVYNF
jgi:hypothetical protein